MMLNKKNINIDCSYEEKISNKLILSVFLFLCFTSLISSQSLITSKINNSISNIGLTLNINYIGDYFTNVYGGLEKRSTYLHNIDIHLSLDLQKAMKWENAKLHTHVLGNHGGAPNDFVGSIQGISNISAPDTWKLYEIWFEQKFFDEKFSILFGLYDLNSEFDVRESSSIFINPSHGIGPDFSLTGKNGPSIFPTTSLALRFIYNISKMFSLKFAVLDGVPGNLNNPKGTHVLLEKNDGLLFAAELNFSKNRENVNSNYFKYGFGAWRYSKAFEMHGSEQNNKTGNYGLYAYAEKFIFSEENKNEGLIGFIRLGVSEKQVNQICTYYGAGFNFLGLIPGRNDEVLGLAISACENSNSFVASHSLTDAQSKIKKYEYITELTYEFKIFDSLRFQPDIQYVINPTFSSTNNSAFVFGARLSVKL